MAEESNMREQEYLKQGIDKKEVEEMQRVKEKEMHREKVNFFINLVHEIRTPLSLISLPLEKRRQKITQLSIAPILGQGIFNILDGRSISSLFTYRPNK